MPFKAKHAQDADGVYAPYVTNAQTNGGPFSPVITWVPGPGGDTRDYMSLSQLTIPHPMITHMMAHTTTHMQRTVLTTLTTTHPSQRTTTPPTCRSWPQTGIANGG
jgi:hypothetical protein